MPVAVSPPPPTTHNYCDNNQKCPTVFQISSVENNWLRVVVKHVIDIELPTIMKPLQEIGVLAKQSGILYRIYKIQVIFMARSTSKRPSPEAQHYMATFLIKNSRDSSRHRQLPLASIFTTRLFWVTRSLRKSVLWQPKININWKAVSFWSYRLMNWGRNPLGNFFGLPKLGTWESTMWWLKIVSASVLSHVAKLYLGSFLSLSSLNITILQGSSLSFSGVIKIGIIKISLPILILF